MPLLSAIVKLNVEQHPPQSMSRCTLRRCAQIWACSDSRRHTYADASPAKQTSHYKSSQCCRRAIEMQTAANGRKNLFSIMLPVRGEETARTNRYRRALSLKPPQSGGSLDLQSVWFSCDLLLRTMQMCCPWEPHCSLMQMSIRVMYNSPKLHGV